MSEFSEVKRLVKKVVDLKNKKEYDQALKILLESREEYPENRFLKTSLADLYARMNRLNEAKELVEEVLLDDSENQNALTVRGNIAFIKRNYEKALKYFKQAYQLKQSDYLASRLIRTYINLDEHDSALGICQQKLEADSDNSRFKKLEAEIYKNMNKIDKAVEVMDDYLSEEKEDQFAFKELIQLKLKDKSPEAAVKELRQLLRVEKYKDNIHLQTLLAEKLQEVERYEEAVEVYKKALLLKPGDSYVTKNLGLCLYKAGKYERALPYLEEAFKEDPNDYYIRSMLEYIYKNLDMHQEGIDFFQGIIKETGLKNLWGIIRKLAKEVDENDKDS
ncbi:MAG: tetratricopeptide repeat protein [Halanaerobiales bacterium]